MNRLYEVTDTLLIWQTIGCLIGLCVSVLLAELVRSSWNFEFQRRPGIALSVALFVWNVGGLANGLLIIAGYSYRSIPAKVACAAGYTGLCFLTWSSIPSGSFLASQSSAPQNVFNSGAKPFKNLAL